MPQINVMLSSRPKLLSEVMQNLIERHSGMKVVGEVIDPIELISALQTMPVDVVIITPLKANGDPRICGQLLKEHPKLRILILTPESKVVYVYQSGFDRIRIEKPSEQTILDIILKQRSREMGDKGKKDHEKRKKQKSMQELNKAKKKQASAPGQENK